MALTLALIFKGANFFGWSITVHTKHDSELVRLAVASPWSTTSQAMVLRPLIPLTVVVVSPPVTLYMGKDKFESIITFFVTLA